MVLGRILSSVWRWLIGESGHERSVLEFAPEANPHEESGANESGANDSGAATKSRASPEFHREARALSLAFDAVHPVARRADLHGRDEQLEMLFNTVLQNGSHAVVHGKRGSGKTSLARVFGYHADCQGAIVIYSAAENAAGFAELFATLIEQLPQSCVRHSAREEWAQLKSSLDRNFRPRALVELLSEVSTASQIIYILDEFDRVTNLNVLEDISTTMKLMSDVMVPVQIVLVGIADSVEQLIHHHPSLLRHIGVVATGRISPDSTDALILNGARQAGLHFSEDSRDFIAEVSCGSPFHVRLFCQHAGIAALRAKRDHVDRAMARHAVENAIVSWAKANRADSQLLQKMAMEDVKAIRQTIQRLRNEAARDQVERGDALFGRSSSRTTDDKSRFPFEFDNSVSLQFFVAALTLRLEELDHHHALSRVEEHAREG